MMVDRIVWSEVPNYSYAEAARYLRMPETTVRYWAKGGSVTRPTGDGRFHKVLTDAPASKLTFANLTELLIVRELRTAFNVPLGAIRRAQLYASEVLGKPLYLHELHTHGRDVFISDLATNLVAASRYGEVALSGFFDGMLARVELDPEYRPEAIFPDVPGSSTQKPVQISPTISFGAPTITGTGIQTSFVAYRINNGESVEEVAQDYGLQIDQIKDAYRFQLVA